MKDYYQVLNVSPAASHEEIKHAFRQLALRYHPDKNPDAAALHRFAEIQEAWYILKDRTRRAAYNQQRFAHLPHKEKWQAHTPDELLRLAELFSQQTLARDPYRINHDQVFFEASRLLATNHITLLRDHPRYRASVLEHLLLALAVLPFPVAKPLIPSLQQLTKENEAAKHLLNQFVSESKIAFYWSRLKIYLALLLAIVFCALLFFLGK